MLTTLLPRRRGRVATISHFSHSVDHPQKVKPRGGWDAARVSRLPDSILTRKLVIFKEWRAVVERVRVTRGSQLSKQSRTSPRAQPQPAEHTVAKSLTSELASMLQLGSEPNSQAAILEHVRQLVRERDTLLRKQLERETLMHNQILLTLPNGWRVFHDANYGVVRATLTYHVLPSLAAEP
jgi:hypothetical protein